MPTEREVQRLSAVYQQYRERGTAETRWSEDNAGNRAIIRERTAVLESLLRAARWLPLAGCRILDVGCGVGTVLASFARWGALPDDLYGVDLLPDRIAEAQQLYPEIHFQHANAERLDFQDAAFDLVLLFTVFTSILSTRMAHNVADEVSRVLKPGGAAVWYDFRYDNPRNPNVRGMPSAAIRALFPDFDLRLRTVTLLPPLARRLGRATPVLYPALALIPPLRTHYLGLLVKHS